MHLRATAFAISCLLAVAAVASERLAADGLGRLGPALTIARSQWQEDACLARLLYEQGEAPPSKFSRGSGPWVKFRYEFYSKADWRQTFTVDAQYQEGRLGPRRAPPYCIGAVELDVEGALKRAARAGLVLDRMSAGSGREYGNGIAAVLVPTAVVRPNADWKPLLRGRVGAAVWVVSSGGLETVIDAFSGRVLLRPQQEDRGYYSGVAVQIYSN